MLLAKCYRNNQNTTPKFYLNWVTMGGGDSKMESGHTFLFFLHFPDTVLLLLVYWMPPPPVCQITNATCNISCVTCHISYVRWHRYHKTVITKIRQFWESVHYPPYVTSNMPHILCHMTPTRCIFFFLGGGRANIGVSSGWRFCHSLGTSRLVLIQTTTVVYLKVTF